MNKWNNWLEKRFSRYAIPNLSLYIVICYGFGYLLGAVNGGFLSYLTLNPYAVLHGQVWRLFTWVLVPPYASSIFFVLISMLFYYSIGTALERTWGTWRYNLYIFSGLLFTVIGAFLLMGYCLLFHSAQVQTYGASTFFSIISSYISTYYVAMSIFLAYAATFPEAQVLFMMIIPLKVKWLGIVYGAVLVYQMIMSPYYVRFAILASLLNFIIFFVSTRNISRYMPGVVRRRRSFRQAVQGKAPSGNAGRYESKHMQARPAMHRCAICGRTDADATLEFRYCSRCEGSYEFCQDHLFSHIHASNGSGPAPKPASTVIEAVATGQNVVVGESSDQQEKE